ncbi:hypothetical protein D1007_50948 [Hordeum vulgare]|uniref:Uncharacterized protein n=1 Tax=Hordeum vulgare subsp. vulgare TaxID=112509 RepID=A0A8I6X8V5_HORVV|nr:uncharacterized protein LOC123450162 [Hordeum vulgare subsp. vulgare]KAE8776420.1 hypothetical protein D1007_50948 [Hordeum vulgare]KAI4998680.1 hypothetical protein ZWY2020_054022 [Hordeum vulgare]
MATTTLTPTTIASPRPSAPFCGRSGWQRARRPPPPSSGSGHGGCARPLDRVAGWVGGGIAAAFFASLERCSCVTVRTHDDLDDDEQRDSVAPLMLDNDGMDDEGRGRSRRRCRGGSRRNDKGRKSAGGGGGMGCYGDQI